MTPPNTAKQLPPEPQDSELARDVAELERDPSKAVALTEEDLRTLEAGEWPARLT